MPAHPHDSRPAQGVTNLIIAGASGRMGRTIARLAARDKAVSIVGAFDRPGTDHIGHDVASLAGEPACTITIADSFAAVIAGLSPDAKTGAILIDFTTPQASLEHLGHCEKNGIGLVVGTTGFDTDAHAHYDAAARTIAIVKSGNMSTGIAVLSALVEQAAARLKEFDLEITEAHHRHKVDAPSGTALMLGAAAARGRDVDLDDVKVAARNGITGARPEEAIGFSVIRGGGIIGDHSVMLASNSETLTLSHHAINRDLFADGAIRAAKWLGGNDNKAQAPGLYAMNDVLGL